jgi:uncharacterized protein with von Willebrand factor type A (vWA) domain
VSWSNVPTAIADTPSSGHHLAANLLHFVRLLRGLGFSVSATQVSDMVEGLTLIDLAGRDDFYYATRPFLVRKPDQLELFDRAFQLFWLGREQWLLELGISHTRQPARVAQPSLRAAARVLSKDRPGDRYMPPDTGDETSPEGTDFSATYSPWETLRHKDFAAMSEDELHLARQCMADLVLSLGQRQTRRRVRAHKRTCCLDLSETVRRSMQHQGEIVRLAWRRPKLKPRPLVLICDISGSM